VHEAAYGGISLFGYWLAPTGSMPVGVQNDTVPIQRQSNLEYVEEKQFRVVRCGNDIVINLSMDSLPTPNPRSAVPFGDGQFPSAQGSR
jgi:hypothetical protein